MTRPELRPLISETTNEARTYTIYSAGGLFTQDELAMNVMIKEAVWRLSNGRFQLFLPQSREIQELDQSAVEAYIRNTDLKAVVNADILLVRFDGLELDSGTVVEYMMAKFLGKPTVILRSDFRSVSFLPECEPYNLMIKNWPRTVEIHLNAFRLWADLFSATYLEVEDNDTQQFLMKTELSTLKNSLDEIAGKLIPALEAVLEMKSPYPPEYQEIVYQISRFSPGSGFDELMTEYELEEVIRRLKENGTI